MHAMLLLGRRATRATISPMAATRLVAMRPLSSSLAVTARPAMATVARRAGLLSLAGSAASVVSGAVALAESKGWPSFEDLQNDPGAVLESLTMEAGPPIGFGAFAGFASGFALKKAGKVAAVLLGGVFVGLQGLASQGIITINWGKATALFDQILDVNGDGKVDKADADAAIKELQEKLTKGMGPAAGGFGGGLLLGLRYG